MTASSAPRGWLTALGGVFVEPAAVTEPRTDDCGVWTAPPVIAVAGLRRGAGVTTIARALAVELALRDAGRAALVTSAASSGRAIPLGTPAAGRLARAASRSGADLVRAAGRLAVVEAQDPPAAARALVGLAPLVVDLAADGGETCAEIAPDAAVLVASPDCQPALASLVAESLWGDAPCVTVLNRALDGEARWDGRCDARVPESRLAAQFAVAGREAPSAFGRAIADLADRVARQAP